MIKAAAAILLSTAAAVQPAVRVVGTEVSSEIWYQRRTDVTVANETALFGAEPYRIVFTISYPGMKLLAPPRTVEVALSREAVPNGESRADPASPALVVIDGLKMPLLQQTQPSAEMIKATVAFEDFEWMVGAKALEFEAFGRRLVLIPSQMTSLHETALEWSHPAPR